MVNTSDHVETNSLNMAEVRTEFQAINMEMNKNLKNICPLIQSLIEKFKNEPDSFETEKVYKVSVLNLRLKINDRPYQDNLKYFNDQIMDHKSKVDF